MTEYIRGKACDNDGSFEHAVAKTIEFLSSDRWEELAAPLDELLWERQLPGSVSVNENTGAYLWDGYGDVFDEAKRRLLIATLGADRYEAALNTAQRLAESYAALDAETDAFGARLRQEGSRRLGDVFDLAKQRTAERSAGPDRS